MDEYVNYLLVHPIKNSSILLLYLRTSVRTLKQKTNKTLYFSHASKTKRLFALICKQQSRKPLLLS